jgi:hypothetical protein
MFNWLTSYFVDNDIKQQLLTSILIKNNIYNNNDEIEYNGHKIKGTLIHNNFENHELTIHQSELIDCGDLIVCLYNFTNLTNTYIKENDTFKFDHSFEYNFKYIIIKYHNMIIDNPISYNPDIKDNEIEFNTFLLKFNNNSLIICDRTIYDTHFIITHSHYNIGKLYDSITNFLK